MLSLLVFWTFDVAVSGRSSKLGILGPVLPWENEYDCMIWYPSALNDSHRRGIMSRRHRAGRLRTQGVFETAWSPRWYNLNLTFCKWLSAWWKYAPRFGWCPALEYNFKVSFTIYCERLTCIHNAPNGTQCHAASTPSSASRNNSNAIECQVCNVDLTNISFKDRNIHYNEHFNDESERESSAMLKWVSGDLEQLQVVLPREGSRSHPSLPAQNHLPNWRQFCSSEMCL